MEFIEILKVMILGIVEGITEWLPISSTGHMILVDEFVKMKVSKDFMDMFLYVIQLGAILAVVTLYFNKLNPFSLKKTTEERMDTITLWIKVVIACIPAVIVGLPFSDKIDEVFQNYQTVAFMLILYGVFFILIENRNKNKEASVTELSQITYKTALIIGLFQVLSVIPGTSRSGATIVGAMLIGVSRYVAAEFTFFLAIPVMFGVSFLKIVDFGLNFTQTEMITLLLGMGVAYVVSILAIKFLMGYIKKNDFKVFGWYRIVLGGLVLVYFLVIK